MHLEKKYKEFVNYLLAVKADLTKIYTFILPSTGMYQVFTKY